MAKLLLLFPQSTYQRLLRNAHIPMFPHSGLALFLLFQQLLLARYIATVAARYDVIGRRHARLMGDDFAADHRVNVDFETDGEAGHLSTRTRGL